MRFPELLWSLVNECDSGAITWSESGVSIIIDYLMFKEEYMNDIGFFKTNNIASFVRQLNLYGFRKCNRQDDYGNRIPEFQHPLFVQGRKDLMMKMKRKSWSMSAKQYFRKPSNANKEAINKIPEFHNYQKKSLKNYLKTSSPHESSNNLNIPIGYIQPHSSLEQMQKFMWNTSLMESDIANSSNPAFHHPWIPPAFYNSQNWNRNISGETGSRIISGETGVNQNLYGNCSNFPYGYPVLQRGDGNAYYLLMAPYAGMYPNPDFYRNAMPTSGLPINVESNGSGDRGSENEPI